MSPMLTPRSAPHPPQHTCEKRQTFFIETFNLPSMGQLKIVMMCRPMSSVQYMRCMRASSCWIGMTLVDRHPLGGLDWYPPLRNKQ